MPLGVDYNYILSGDGKESMERVAYELGIDKIYSSAALEGKKFL
ncbi:hypothetical protein [Thermohydrogenium kirishiense]